MDEEQIPLRIHIDRVFDNMKALIEADRRWMEEVKAHRERERNQVDCKIKELEITLKEHNNLQRQLDKQKESFLTRSEYEEKHKLVNDFMVGMKATASQKSVLIAYIISFISLITTIILHFTK